MNSPLHPLAVAASLCVGLTAGPSSGGPVTTTTIRMKKGHHVEAALLADVDGVNGRDLVLATVHSQKFRHLQVHRRRPGVACFDAEADLEYELLPSVIAFAAGDVEVEPGEEVVLFTVRGAYAWTTAAGVETLPRPLVRGELLWQLPNRSRAFSWQAGMRDVDGDGLTDVVFPETDGYKVAMQRRDATGSRFVADVWPKLPTAGFQESPDSPGGQLMRAEARAREISISLSLEEGDGAYGPAELSVVEAVPAPIFADFDGDRRTDLLALSGDRLLVWPLRGDALTADPDPVLEFPVEIDLGRRLDLSFGAHVGDFDQNGRADCVILAGDRKSEDIRTQVLVYLNGVGAEKTAGRPLFGPHGAPQQVLLIGGVVGGVKVTDIDGDGAPDLALAAVKIDAIDALRAASSGSINASIRVHLNRNGRLSREPDLVFPLEISVGAIEEAGHRLAAQFIPDCTGDGIRELLVRDTAERLRIYLVRREGRGLAVHPRPLEELAVSRHARLLIEEDPGGGPPEIILLERTQLRHLRFDQ